MTGYTIAPYGYNVDMCLRDSLQTVTTLITTLQAAQKGRECVGLEAYMPRVHRMVRQYGYRAIYLATDSEV